MAQAAPARASAWLGVAGAVLLLAAVGLGVLAFTRFEEPPASDDPEAVERWNERAYDDAFLSAALGIAAAFSLAGGLGCLQAMRRKRG